MHKKNWKLVAQEQSENRNLLEFPAFKQITILTPIILSVTYNLKTEESKLFS